MKECEPESVKECEPEGLGELVGPVVLAGRPTQVGRPKAWQQQSQKEIKNLGIVYI